GPPAPFLALAPLPLPALLGESAEAGGASSATWAGGTTARLPVFLVALGVGTAAAGGVVLSLSTLRRALSCSAVGSCLPRSHAEIVAGLTPSLAARSAWLRD